MKTKKSEKMYKTGTVFQLVDVNDEYMFCQVARLKFALINMKNGNRYREMQGYPNYSSIEYPLSFIQKLAGDTKVIPV